MVDYVLVVVVVLLLLLGKDRTNNVAII